VYGGGGVIRVNAARIRRQQRAVPVGLVLLGDLGAMSVRPGKLAVSLTFLDVRSVNRYRRVGKLSVERRVGESVISRGDRGRVVSLECGHPRR